MGDLNKKYCETCKAEFSEASFSQGQESGTVKLKMAVWKETGGTVEGESVEICSVCHEKMLKWIVAKRKAADTAWSVENPTPAAVTPPNL